MPLSTLFRTSAGVSSGVVTGVLLSGQYRVLYRGRPAVATSQAGALSAGQQVTIAETGAGLVIVSAGQASAVDITEVVISG